MNFAKKSVIYSGEWERIPFTDEFDIVYTKTSGKSAPITTTVVGQRPCLEPGQSKVYPVDNYLYDLELYDKQTSCPIDLPGVPAEDPRYIKLDNYETNEFDV